MFISPNLPMLFKSADLKLGEEDARNAAVALVLEPLTPALARELGDEVYQHLFNGEGVVRPEVTEITFQPRPGTKLQAVTVRAAPDAPGASVLQTVTIDGYKVSKPDPDKPRLKVTIAASYSLADRIHRSFTVDRFGTQAFFSFRPS